MAEEMTGAVEGAGGLRLFYRSREAPGSRGRLLAVHGLAPGDLAGRVRVLAMHRRRADPEHFATVAGALLEEIGRAHV